MTWIILEILQWKGFNLLHLEAGQKFFARSCVLSFGLENVVTSELRNWFSPLPNGSQEKPWKLAWEEEGRRPQESCGVGGSSVHRGNPNCPELAPFWKEVKLFLGLSSLPPYYHTHVHPALWGKAVVSHH